MLERKARRAYEMHRFNADRRGIPFQLSFEQWHKIWLRSGHIDERGKHVGQYVMARKGDKGPYAVHNVKIVTVSQNHKELKHTDEARERIGDWSRGKPKPMQQRAKMSAAQIGRVFSDETKRKMSEAAKRRVARMDPIVLQKRMKHINEIKLQNLRREKNG